MRLLAHQSLGRAGIWRIHVAKTLDMVIEHFKGGDAAPVYRRFRDRGRLAPEGCELGGFEFECCYQLMETNNPQLLDEWVHTA
jgi:hypothetical protein